jgi:hypothetical protein
MILSKKLLSGRKNNIFNNKNKSIIDNRAMEIERSREKSLRRQFEYIVHNVKVSSFL